MKDRRQQASSAGLRQAGQYLAIVLGLALALIGILLSPYVLAAIGKRSSDWANIANIGQAYGGISAVLSGLALVAVTVSLLLQRRQISSDRAYGDRQRHFDLIKLAFEEPELIEVLDFEGARMPDARQRMYANLWVAFWLTSWSHGGMSEKTARRHLDEMFRGPAAWNWWATVGPVWSTSGSRKERYFIQIVAEAWRNAPVPPSADTNSVATATAGTADARDVD